MGPGRPALAAAPAAEVIVPSGWLLPLTWWAPLGAAVLASQIFLTWLVFRARGRALVRMTGWLLIADALLVLLLRHCTWEMGRLDYSEQFLVWRQWLVWLGVLLAPAPVALWTAALHLARPKGQADERRPIINPAFLAALLMWIASASLTIALGADSSLISRPARLTRVEVPIPDLPREFDGLRIAVLADLHIGPLMNPDRTRLALRPLSQEKPDMVVVVGDIIGTSTWPPAWTPSPKNCPRPGSPISTMTRWRSRAEMPGSGWSASAIPGPGTTTCREHRRAFLRAPQSSCSPTPRTFCRRPAPKASPSSSPGTCTADRSSFRSRGTKAPVGDTFLVVSRGIGYEWIPLRLFCPPEIVLITLRAEN